MLSDVVMVVAFFSTYVLPGASISLLPYCRIYEIRTTELTICVCYVAAIHIIMHNFRRPLSIVIPPSAPVTPNPAAYMSHPHPHPNIHSANSHLATSPYSASSNLSVPSPTSALSSSSRDDELLQRKERTLQRRRLTRRIVWDIGGWVLLLPVGGGGLGWAAGRIAGKW